jgi:hypothetical protein
MGTAINSSYPILPIKHWWSLRKMFHTTVPPAITPAYLAKNLGMQEVSARTNLIPALIQFGMIEEGDKPTKLIYKWRDDSSYSEVCKELIEKIYPPELNKMVDLQNPDRASIKSWFMRNMEVGVQSADKMTAVYMLLLDGNPSNQSESTKKTLNNTNKNQQKVIKKTIEAPKQLSQINPTTIQPTPNFSPAIHIDLQIHIAPETSPEQINKIFESIAKHLFKQGNTNG